MRILIFLTCFWTGITSTFAQNPAWQEFQTPVKASLRGLSPVSDLVCWASGSGGTWLKTTDGGKSWDHGVIAGLDTVDFRSIHAVDEKVAVVASAGQPAVIYRTEDGGTSWTKVHQEGKEAFFDAITFIDKKKGFVLGDPVDGKWMILETSDGGKSWKSLPHLPKADDGEAAFAASSSSLIAHKDQLILGTGGRTSNLHIYSLAKSEWTKIPVPLMIQGKSSQGIFALTHFKNQLILAGGDYANPEIREGNLLIWSGREFIAPNQTTKGYRSGVTLLKKNGLLIAVGPDGSDFSVDGGRNWQNFSSVGFHAVKTTDDQKSIWASGSQGRIGRLID
ncbi:YCF48-related protein [Algoriphagus sp. AK58]|uniref:WD40/YVTN/BNR-like repeat-containing protein n=1 Tax=Algoriphagus sp. AK58 TaxID=1406877 RepID=UPI00164FC528|nr:YCF48-related protein [Algoriphagus sp. AK58]MBC6367682.1 photosystem II stability/assembly factor-like protein [Algoriphagus sp. AK58]